MMIADLSLSQDLDRDAVAAVIGAGYYQFLYANYETTAWSSYYGKQVLATYSNRQVEKWTRHRVQYETSYWNYFF
jgi:hypothetical protein